VSSSRIAYIRLNPEVVSTDVAAFRPRCKRPEKRRGWSACKKLTETVGYYRGAAARIYDDWALRSANA